MSTSAVGLSASSASEHPVIVRAAWRLLHGRMGARLMAVEAAQRHGAPTTPDLRKIGGRAGEARAQLDRELVETSAPLDTEAAAIDARLGDIETAKARLVSDLAEAGDEADPRIVRMRRAIATGLSLGIVVLAVVAGSLSDGDDAARLLWPGVAAMCLAGVVGGVCGVVVIRHRARWVFVGALAAGVTVVAAAVLIAHAADADVVQATIRGVGALLCAAGVATVWWLSLRSDGPRRVDAMLAEALRLAAETERLRSRRAELVAELDGLRARHRSLVRELCGVAERAIATFIEAVVEHSAGRTDIARIEAELRAVGDGLIGRLSDPAPA